MVFAVATAALAADYALTVACCWLCTSFVLVVTALLSGVLLLESALALVLVATPSAVAVVKTAIVERTSLAIFLLIIV